MASGQDDEFSLCERVSKVSLVEKKKDSPVLTAEVCEMHGNKVLKEADVNVELEAVQAVGRKIGGDKMEAILTELSKDFAANIQIHSTEKKDEMNGGLKHVTSAVREVEENKESGSSDEGEHLQGRGPDKGIPVRRPDLNPVNEFLMQWSPNSLAEEGFKIVEHVLRNQQFLSKQDSSPRKFRRPNESDHQSPNNDMQQSPMQPAVSHQVYPQAISIQRQVGHHPIGMQYYASPLVGMQNNSHQSFMRPQIINDEYLLPVSAGEFYAPQTMPVTQLTFHSPMMQNQYPQPITTQQRDVQTFETMRQLVSQPTVIQQHIPRMITTQYYVAQPGNMQPCHSQVNTAFDFNMSGMNVRDLNHRYTFPHPQNSSTIPLKATGKDFVIPHSLEKNLFPVKHCNPLTDDSDIPPSSSGSFPALSSGIESYFEGVDLLSSDDINGIELDSFNSLLENLIKQDGLSETEQKEIPIAAAVLGSKESNRFPMSVNTPQHIISSDSYQTLHRSPCKVMGHSPGSSNAGQDTSPFSDSELAMGFLSPSSVKSHESRDSGYPNEHDVADVTIFAVPHSSTIPVSVEELEIDFDSPSGQDNDPTGGLKHSSTKKTTRQRNKTSRTPKCKKQPTVLCNGGQVNAACNGEIHTNEFNGGLNPIMTMTTNTLTGSAQLQNGSVLPTSNSHSVCADQTYMMMNNNYNLNQYQQELGRAAPQQGEVDLLQQMGRMGPQHQLIRVGPCQQMGRMGPQQQMGRMGPCQQMGTMGPQQQLAGVVPHQQLTGVGLQQQLTGVGPRQQLAGVGLQPQMGGTDSLLQQMGRTGSQQQLTGVGSQHQMVGVGLQQQLRLAGSQRTNLQQVNPRFIPPSTVPQQHVITASQCSNPVPQLEDIKIYRQVAGMSTERLVQADQDGDTKLHFAISRGENKLVEALLDRLDREGLLDDIMRVVNHNQQTPLFLAVVMNNAPIVRRLMDRGSDVNEVVRKVNAHESGLSHFTLLHYAVSKGASFVPTLHELLNTPNIVVNACNSQGLTPLHVSINSHGNKMSRASDEIIDSMSAIFLLAKHGANLNAPDGLNGKTPLHYIIEKKDARLMNWFLELVTHLNQVGAPAGGVDTLRAILNTRTSAGLTPVHLAGLQQMALAERDKIIQILLESEARAGKDGIMSYEQSVRGNFR